jgi:hypothetical protein
MSSHSVYSIKLHIHHHLLNVLKQHNHLKERIDHQGLDKKKRQKLLRICSALDFFSSNFPQTTGLRELTLDTLKGI